MDQSLMNFWKNYEDVINWGYRMSGVQAIGKPDVSGSTTQTQVCFYKYDNRLIMY